MNKDKSVQPWDLPATREAMDELQFIVTSDGRVGVGWSNRGEDGGFSILKWMAEDMLVSAFERKHHIGPSGGSQHRGN